MLAGSYETRIGDRGLRVLLVDLQEHLSPRKLAEQLYSESRNELTVADILVIRPAVDQPMSDTQELASNMEPVFERVAKLPVHFLTSHDFQHRLSANVHPGVNESLSEQERIALIPALRQAELADIAKRSKAMLRADGPNIFRAPSKTYCQRFLRAGNVQMHRGTLDVFFFWMLPWLKDCHVIVADTWTISSIVLNATRLLARYEPKQGRCKVDMLAEYQDGSTEADTTADAVLERVVHGSHGVALAVFSACMTGNAVSRLKATTERHTLEGLTFRFGALYSLEANLPVESLCELFKEAPENAFQHFDELPKTEGEMRIIDIDKTTYFPSVVLESEVAVDKIAATHADQFFKDYGHSGAFFVHRNSYVAGQKYRHHAIYPDLSVFLKQDCFQSRLQEKLAQLDHPPTLVVTPPHEPGREMAAFASEFLASQHGHSIRFWEHLDLVFPRDASAEEKELCQTLQNLDEASAILVLDDVSVTGGRLVRYQKSLRDIGFRGQIHYLVGLARPERMSAWTRRTRDLRYRDGQALKHTLNHVEFLLLPDWNEDRCPWCKEQALYGRLVLELGELPILFARRNAELAPTNADRGAFQNLFMSHPPDFKFRLTENSLFAPPDCSEAAVFAAVASAIQRLRTDDDPRRNLAQQNYPQATCICPHDYLGNTFTDPILRAAILRSARRAEVERVKGEDEAHRSALAKSILLADKSDEHSVSIELLIAIATRKVPLPTFSGNEMKILEERGVAEFLKLVTLLVK